MYSGSSHKFDLALESINPLFGLTCSLLGIFVCCIFISRDGILSCSRLGAEFFNIILTPLNRVNHHCWLVLTQVSERSLNSVGEFRGAKVFVVACGSSNTSCRLSTLLKFNLLLFKSVDLAPQLHIILNFGQTIKNPWDTLFLVLLLVCPIFERFRHFISLRCRGTL